MEKSKQDKCHCPQMKASRGPLCLRKEVQTLDSGPGPCSSPLGWASFPCLGVPCSSLSPPPGCPDRLLVTVSLCFQGTWHVFRISITPKTLLLPSGTRIPGGKASRPGQSSCPPTGRGLSSEAMSHSLCSTKGGFGPLEGLRQAFLRSILFHSVAPPTPATPGLHILVKVQSALVICGFFVCTFASALTFVTPQISTRNAFVVTCGRAGQ